MDAETGGRRSALETAYVRRDRKSGDDTAEIPRRNGLFAVADETRGLGGLGGGRDRDRTCDPLDVNEVLSR